MIYLKSLLAGLATLIIIVALIIGVAVLAPVIMERLQPPDGAAGVGVSVIGPFSIWPVAIGAWLAFAVVSYWFFKRASRGSDRKSVV